MQFFTTGIETVDKMGQLSYKGNLKPLIWNKTMINEKKKPQRLAMDILADIAYWYRPVEVRDERSGQVIGWKKKFNADYLQRSYSELMVQFGEDRKTIMRALVYLEDIGVIKRIFRKLKFKNGMVNNNVMFIALNFEKFYELTYPPEDESENDKKDVINSYCDEYEILSDSLNGEEAFKTEDLYLCTEDDTPVYSEVQTYGHTCPEIYTQVSTPISDNDQSLNTQMSIASDTDVQTNTKNTTENTTKISPSVSSSDQMENTSAERSDADMDIDLISMYVDELIGYEFLHEDTEGLDSDAIGKAIEFNSVLNDIRQVLVYEVFAAPDSKQFNLGSRERPDNKPKSILVSVFTKNLSYAIVRAYIQQYLMNSMQVKNAAMSHIKSLYRQCLTQSSQYMSGKNNFYARGET